MLGALYTYVELVIRLLMSRGNARVTWCFPLPVPGYGTNPEKGVYSTLSVWVLIRTDPA